MMGTISLFEQLATEAARMRIAAFPAKIARWADADGFNEAFVLHWRKCFSIRSLSKQVRTAAGGTPPFRATPTPQRRISICRIEWASGSMLMRHPAVSAVPRRNASSAVHLRMLLTPPRNAPSSPAALAALSPMLARTGLLCLLEDFGIVGSRLQGA